MIAPGKPLAASRIQELLAKAQPQELFPQADRLGAPQGEPPIVPAYRGDQLLGYVYLNADFANAVGYSGKPIHVLVGIDPGGVVRGIRLVEHKEPIVLVGIPEKRIIDAVNTVVGKNFGPIASGAERPPQVDIVSGATVTVLVTGDSVVRSAVRLIRSGRLGDSGRGAASVAVSAMKTVDLAQSETRDWESLVGDGSVRRLNLTVGEVSEAFAKSGNQEAAANPETADPNETFIDLFVALASVPTIGRSLLGDEGYDRLQQRLKPGQQAIIVAGEGAYSFKGSGYVRGGIFDRIELVQDGSSTRFRDRNHTRLGNLAAAGAPALREIALFVTPEEYSLNPTEPWQLQLLAQRNVGARDKAFLAFDIAYATPETYLKTEPPPAPAQPAGAAATAEAQQPLASTQPRGPATAHSLNDADALAAGPVDEPLWQRIWKTNTVSVGITIIALGILTLIFFFQDWLVARPLLYTWVRRGFLAFTLVWLGWYANAQLSVVNVITFSNALITEFSWEFFLTAPLVFILWSSVHEHSV